MSSSKVSTLRLTSSRATITAPSPPSSTVTSTPLSLVSRTPACSLSPASWPLRPPNCFSTAWLVSVPSTSQQASGESSHKRPECIKCFPRSLSTRLNSKHSSGQPLPSVQSSHDAVNDSSLHNVTVFLFSCKLFIINKHTFGPGRSKKCQNQQIFLSEVQKDGNFYRIFFRNWLKWLIDEQNCWIHGSWCSSYGNILLILWPKTVKRQVSSCIRMLNQRVG